MNGPLSSALWTGTWHMQYMHGIGTQKGDLRGKMYGSDSEEGVGWFASDPDRQLNSKLCTQKINFILVLQNFEK